MKTKKLFLKLFLAAFFLAGFVPKDASAVNGQTELNISQGNIYISDDKVGYGDASGVTGGFGVNDRGYTITGPSIGTRTITIDVSNGVDLSFEDLDMNGNCQLIVEHGNVSVKLIGNNNRIVATGTHAVELKSDSQLIFSDGQIAISGGVGKDAVHGGSLLINSGTVTLNKFGTGKPFNGTAVLISGGKLICYEDGQKTPVGEGVIIQNGGEIIAAELAEINYETGQIINIPSSVTTVKIKGGSGADITVPSNKVIDIQDEPINWFGQTLIIGRQELYIPERPKKDPGIRVSKDETVALANDGELTNINMETMEYVGPIANEMADMQELAKYIKDNRLNWQEFTSDTKSDCAPGWYYTRLKSDPIKKVFASNPVPYAKQIKQGKVIDFDLPEIEAPYGYSPAPNGALTVNNYGSDSVTINQVKLMDSTDKFTVTNDKGVIVNGRADKNSPPGTNSSITITPATDLVVGKYSAKIQIGYKIGSGNNKTTDATITFEVTRAEQNAPTDTLSVTKITHNSATLNGISKNPNNKDSDSGVEYCYSEDGEWDDSARSDKPEFSKKLKPDTTYYFLARYKQSKNYKASEPIKSDPVKTDPATYIDFDTEEFVFPYAERKYTVSAGKGTASQSITSGVDKRNKIPNSLFGKTVSITDTVTDGLQEGLVIPKIAKAPTPVAVDEKFIGDKGEITKVTTAMEYRMKLEDGSWGQWQNCQDTTIPQADPGTYQIRIRATDKAFASEIAEVTVHKGPSISVDLQGNDFEGITYGTTRTGKIIIQNHDTIPIKIEGMKLSAEGFTITEGATTIEPEAITEWQIQTKEKLNVGTYESELIVSYNDKPDDGSGDGNPDDSNPDDNNPGGNPDDNNPGGNPDDNNPGGNPDDNNPGGNPDDNNPGGNPDDNTGGTGDKDDSDPDAPTTRAQAAEREGTEEDETTGDGQEHIRETSPIAVKATVVKATQDPPPVPAEKTKTATSITLETIPNSPISGAKAQYSKDGGKTWQDSPTFTGLSANREYTFVARYAETENYEASEISAGEIAITTSEKTDDDSSVKPNANDNNSNGSNNGSNNGTNGTNGNGANGTNGTNGNGTDGSGGVLSSAKTGDLNNISLWASLLIISYISSAIIIKGRMKKSKA